ncbi:PAAR domain-containing protein, partial [Nostoc sp. ChiVER01]|uniref:PAAR domain-containing protein n=1 Tax=Nostoc sp. ChiVER01 TaxID=3075382 RepID=UPI002AD38143
MGKPAARITDRVQHPLPPVLTPGTTGSPNVMIGGKPAWRGLPSAQAAIVSAAKEVADTLVKTAEQVTKAANFPPAKAAAFAAEQATKTAVATSMTSLIATSASTAAATTAASGSFGTVDLHACMTPSPIPPHGVGVVIDASSTVLINGLPACFEGNTILEPLGSPNKIISGCSSVLIGTGSASPISVDISSIATSMTNQAAQASQKAAQDVQEKAKQASEG